MHLKCISLAFIFILSPGQTIAADSPDQQVVPDRKHKIELAPTSHIYSPYLADPKRVTFALQILHVPQSDIPEGGSNRFGLRMGGRLEIFNWSREDDPLTQLQANLEVGFRGHFDIDHSEDNIGWDGNYGLLFSYRQSPGLAYRFGTYHTSSHIGDEYFQRTGRRRIEYTREELLAGAQFNLNRQWQYYLEAGYGYFLKDKPLQKPLRLQTGIQFQESSIANEERLGWYAGLDLSAYEERDWSLNRAFQVGFALAAEPFVWRIALDYYHGQSVLGEFFQHHEEYIGFGLYLDI